MKKLKQNLKGFYIKLRYAKKTLPNDKVIIIELVESKFNRYLYPLFFMLHKNGYKPVLKVKNRELTNMYYDVYQKLIFKNGLYFKPSRGMKVVKNIVLDPDYFSALLKNDNRENIIPMCMHPSIYAKGIKPTQYHVSNRVVFFAGTISEKHHNKKQIFEGVLTRFEIIEFLKSFKNSIYVNKKSNIDTIYNANHNTNFIIYDTNIVNLKPKKLFEKLSRSSFFLGLPGRGMPLSHNIIEAMCCCCIPILQDIYANMFPIPLENKVNCLIYKNKGDLKNISNVIDNLEEKKINEMKENVKKYYDNYLSSKAITSLITKTENKHFYLMAEGRSIILYKQNILKNI